MRRALFALVGTVTGLVMLLSFKTHPLATATLPAAVAAGPTGGTLPAPTTAVPTTGNSAAAAVPSTSTPAPSSSAAPAAGTYTGAAADTRYGPVQVEITVTGGKVTAVQAVEYPQDNPRDAEINQYAVPQLNAEATAAGTAGIDTVSGATYTSEGYIASLQSALDQAGL